jgi:hypothetical protein
MHLMTAFATLGRVYVLKLFRHGRAVIAGQQPFNDEEAVVVELLFLTFGQVGRDAQLMQSLLCVHGFPPWIAIGVKRLGRFVPASEKKRFARLRVVDNPSCATRPDRRFDNVGSTPYEATAVPSEKSFEHGDGPAL